MADITANLIEIGNPTSSFIAVRVKEYSPKVEPLYASATRNMEGAFRGALIGNFTNLVLKTAPMTQSSMQTLIGLLLQPSFNVKYYDAQTGTVKTESFHLNGNINPTLQQRQGSYWQELEFDIVANTKRSW